jgi:hypothetical protein
MERGISFIVKPSPKGPLIKASLGDLKLALDPLLVTFMTSIELSVVCSDATVKQESERKTNITTIVWEGGDEFLRIFDQSM